MKTCFALCAILCVLCVETSAVSAPFRAPSTRPIEHVPGCLWQEAEAFDDYGDWKLDTQFTHKIGSAVLVCPGLDKPTEHPARTTVSFPHAGLWRVWVRTRDWIPEFSPGVPVSALRVTVTKTWGVPEARILEIRAYARHARGGARRRARRLTPPRGSAIIGATQGNVSRNSFLRSDECWLLVFERFCLQLSRFFHAEIT